MIQINMEETEITSCAEPDPPLRSRNQGCCDLCFLYLIGLNLSLVGKSDVCNVIIADLEEQHVRDE